MQSFLVLIYGNQQSHIMGVESQDVTVYSNQVLCYLAFQQSFTMAINSDFVC